MDGVNPGEAFYPFNSGFADEVGAGPGAGRNVNLPWKREGENDADYLVSRAGEEGGGQRSSASVAPAAAFFCRCHSLLLLSGT